MIILYIQGTLRDSYIAGLREFYSEEQCILQSPPVTLQDILCNGCETIFYQKKLSGVVLSTLPTCTLFQAEYESSPVLIYYVRMAEKNSNRTIRTCDPAERDIFPGCAFYMVCSLTLIVDSPLLITLVVGWAAHG